MPEPGFSPDLLLVVGADLTQLRQQLAGLQRELQIPPVDVLIRVQGINEFRQQLAGIQNDLKIPPIDIQVRAQGIVELRQQIAGIQNDLRIPPVEVQVRAQGITELRQQLTNLQRDLRIPPVDVQVNVQGLTQVQQQLASLQREIPPIDVPIRVQGVTQIREQLAFIRQEIPPIDVQVRLQGIPQVRQQLAGLQLDLPPIDVQVRAQGITELRQQLATSVQREIPPVDVPIRAQGLTELRQQLASIRDLPPVDVLVRAQGIAELRQQLAGIELRVPPVDVLVRAQGITELRQQLASLQRDLPPVDVLVRTPGIALLRQQLESLQREIPSIDVQIRVQGIAEVRQQLAILQRDLPPVDIQVRVQGVAEVRQQLAILQRDLPPIDIQVRVQGVAEVRQQLAILQRDLPPIDIQVRLQGVAEVRQQLASLRDIPPIDVLVRAQGITELRQAVANLQRELQALPTEARRRPATPSANAPVDMWLGPAGTAPTGAPTVVDVRLRAVGIPELRQQITTELRIPPIDVQIRLQGLTEARQQITNLRRELQAMPVETQRRPSATSPANASVDMWLGPAGNAPVGEVSQFVKELSGSMTALRQQAISDVQAMTGAIRGLGDEFTKLNEKQKQAAIERRDLFLAEERGKPIVIQRDREIQEREAKAKDEAEIAAIEQRRQIEKRDNEAKADAEIAAIRQRRQIEERDSEAKLNADIEAIKQKRQVQERDSEAKANAEIAAIRQKRQVQERDAEAKANAEIATIQQKRQVQERDAEAKANTERASIQQRRQIQERDAVAKAEQDKVKEAKRSADERLAIELKLEKQIGELQAARARLSRVGQIASTLPGAGGPELQQRIGAARAQIAQVQESVSVGTPAGAKDLQRLNNDMAAVNQTLAASKGAAAGADSALGNFFGKLSRYAQIAGGLTIVYGAMRAVFAGVQEFIEVDKQLARIAATMGANFDQATVLRNSYELMRQANKLLGTSFSEAGKVVFELEKSLGNSAAEINAAFLPALTLASLGEGNQTEILRTLVGVYKLFGDTLGNITPQEKYLKISDALIASSAASIQDIDGFRTALQNVAPVAKQANVSLEATLASLVILTNGMQSASRAGTGLRQLLVDLQTRPAAISKIFDVPFDPDKPLNATKLLDTIIKKIRELGTDSVKTQAMINAAFPDKRATLAFETLIELYPQYSQALRDVENASGRTAAAQRELANQVGAAIGRLTGTLFDEAVKNINALFSVQPGQANGLVKFIDAISFAIQKFSDVTQEASVRLRQLLLLTNVENNKNFVAGAIVGGVVGGLPGAAIGATAGAAIDLGQQNRARSLPPGAVDQDAWLKMTAAQEAWAKSFRETVIGTLSPERLKQFQALNKLLPREQELQAGRDAEFALRNAQFAEASPAVEGQIASERIRKSLTAEILANMEARLRMAALEEMASDRSLSYSNRLAAAQQILTEKIRETTLARNDFESTAALRPQDVADIEQYRGKYAQAVEAQRRAAEQVRELRRGNREESQKFIDDAAEIEKKITELFTKVDVERSKLKDSSGLERAIADYKKLVNTFEEEAKKLPLSTAEADKLKALYQELGDAILQYWVDPLLAITRLDYENTWDTFNRGLQKNIRDAERLQGISSQLGKPVPTGAEVEQRSIERQLGLDETSNELQRLRNEIGFTREEVVANFAAMKAGAKDFADLLAQIEMLPEYVEVMGGLVIQNPARRRKEIARDTISGKIVPAETEKISLEIQRDIQKEQNQLDGLRDGYGRVGVELDKYIIARDRWRDSFDRLEPAQKAEIERLVDLIEKTKLAAAASGLRSLGFSGEDSERLAKQAADLAASQALINSGIQQIRALNDASEVARQQIEEFIQESARATGDFVAFFISKMRDAANVGGDFWKGLATLAEDTSKAMAASLSDFFFDTFTGKATSAKKVWEDFLNSMLRSISNFLAQQATKAFLNLLLGTGTGGGINFNAGGGFGGGGGGGDFANSPDSGLVAGLATNVLASYLGGGTGASAVGGGGLSLQSLIAPVLNQGASAVSGGPGLYSGIANASTNFAAGGVSGVAFGVPTVVANGTTIVVPAGTQGYALAELGAIGVDASAGGTSGLVGAAGSLSGAIGSATVVLAALAAAYSVYTGVTALEQNKQGTKGYNAGLGTLSGVAGGAIAGAIIGTVVYPAIGTVAGAIIGGAVGGGTGGLVGGLFGDDVARGVVERQEVATSYRRVDQFLTNFATTKSPLETELALLAQGQIQLGGLKGELPLNQDDQAISIGLKNLVFTQEQFLQAIQSGQYQLKVGTPIPATLEELTALLAASPQGTGQAYQSAPGVVSVPIVNIGQPNQYQDTLSHGAFTQFVNQYGQAGLPGADTSISSYIHAGVNPAAMEQANYAIIQTIIGKIAAFRELNLQVNNALNEVLKQTILPAEGFVDQVRQQAQQFRQIINGLVFANRQEIAGQYAKLNAETNPVEILKYVETIKGLISSRYTDEINLVKQFADALDQLASGFKQVSQSIQDQIDSLNASNLGPTNPLDAFQTAQARFNEAREEFFRDPTPETAARVQQRVQPLLEAAGQIFTRPSPEYQDIFQNTINTLQDVKQDVDQQVTDIEANLSIALGTANSIAELTQQNTRQMAEDMRVLRAVAEQKLEALGFDIFPTTAVPQAQGGASYTHEGMYYLHEGERVLNAHDAAISRSSGGSVAASLTISSGAIVINGAHDPNATGRAVIEHVENSIRTGRLGRVISDRVRSKV